MATISYPAQVVTTPVSDSLGIFSLNVPDLHDVMIELDSEVSGSRDEVKAAAGKMVNKALYLNATRGLAPPVPTALEAIPEYRPPTGCVEVERFMVTAEMPPAVRYTFYGTLPAAVAQKAQEQFRQQVEAAIRDIAAKLSR